MDETTDISEIKQCVVVIIYFDIKSMTVKTQFLDMIETVSGTADDLTDTLLKCASDKGIEKNMMVGFSPDTTNAMAGKFHSVFTNLKTAVPGIACIKCSCHMIHFSASKAFLKLPRSIEDLLRNVGSHFSRSHSRQSKYKNFQEFFQAEMHKILSPCTTRWLSLKACVDRILEQFPALKEYFRLVNFEDPSKTSELIFSTIENSFSIFYLEFMSYSTWSPDEFQHFVSWGRASITSTKTWN
ncbi:uncharacterized protein LOC111035088 [Myzus persicae]|uniref:uncharacterized protein LOC111035088 n=1 Tax=Myzus persicae TaxID=13164 RepID=UPI000B930C69|nr:uncharacterized protein LOC111035088 [Myzus persicae]